jgi:hypothetical protein
MTAADGKERVKDWGKTRIKQRAESALVTGTEHS